MKRFLMVVSFLALGALPLKGFADFGVEPGLDYIDTIEDGFHYCGDSYKDSWEDCDDGPGGNCPDDCKITFTYDPPPPPPDEPKDEVKETVPTSSKPVDDKVALNPNFMGVSGSGCTLGGLGGNGGPADLWILLVAALPLWLKRNKKK